ncbi:MAG: alpha/beta hydrolase-fold protein [Cyanobacteria bacterium J06621_11]
MSFSESFSRGQVGRSVAFMPGALALWLGSAWLGPAIAMPQPTTSAPAASAMSKTAVEIGPDPFNEATYSEDVYSEDAYSEDVYSEDAYSEDAYSEDKYSTVLGSVQMTEITEPDGTTVILPPGYQADRAYPALVLMPYTDRTALHMFNWGIYDAYQRRQENSFVIIMPPGQGSSANWSGYGWESLVNEYEQYVHQSLDPIAAKYNVDPNQMVIGGFSLGGDLSWALSLRNPGIFSGAIVMGSMSNYRNTQNAQLLAASDFRYFMVMGGYDGNRGSMYNALDALDQHAIEYHYEEVSNAGHGDLPEQMQNDLFLSAMDYVLAERLATLQR